MELFTGTLIIVTLCCLALGLGAIFSGKPLSGGCGREMPENGRCAGCPGRQARDGCPARTNQ